MRSSFVKYTLFPGIVPRFAELFKSGFAFVASFLAVIYGNVGLLPKNHPYLQQRNFGRYGVRHVFAEAGRNIVFKRENIDHIIIYFVTLAAIVLIVLQIILLLFAFLYHPAFAAGPDYRFLIDGTGTPRIPTFYNFFALTPPGHGPEQDIAFVVLDKVFGIRTMSGTSTFESFFGSCAATIPLETCTNIYGEFPLPLPAGLAGGIPAFLPSLNLYPTSFHYALHNLLYFYTMGIAFLSTIVIFYFIATIVGETVTSGTPFGRRLNRAWFIPRLIVFFALIAPISISATSPFLPAISNSNAGINVAQLIVFSAAKFGSNMATNLWLGFVDTAVTNANSLGTVPGTPGLNPTGNNAVSTSLGVGQSMIARPQIPEIGGLTHFMFLVRACMYAEEIIHGNPMRIYVVRPPSERTGLITGLQGIPVPYQSLGTTLQAFDLSATATDDSVDITFAPLNLLFFDFLVSFSRFRTVVLRFGHRDENMYPDEWGYVDPTCGEMHFQLNSLDPYVINNVASALDFGIQETYFYLVMRMLKEDGVAADELTYCMLEATLPFHHRNRCVFENYTVGGIAYNVPAPAAPPVTTNWLTTQAIRADIEYFNDYARELLIGDVSDWNVYNRQTNFFDDNDVIGYITNHQNDETVLATFGPFALNVRSTMLMPVEIRQRGWAGASLWYNRIAEINGMISSAVANRPVIFKYPRVMEQVESAHKSETPNITSVGRFNPRLPNGRLADLSRPGDQNIAATLFSIHSFWGGTNVQETVYTRSSGNAVIDTLNTVLGTNGIYDVLNNQGTHPLALLSGLGKGMVDAALRNMFLGIVGTVGSFVGGEVIGPIAGVLGKFAFRFGMIALSIGFILYYVLPLMPFIYFFFAFSGWIKSIFEAVVAMPLWAVAHIRIDGEGLPGPLATNGYFLLLEIFLRPSLIIAGFILSVGIFTALVNVLNSAFPLLVSVVGGGDVTLAADINAPLSTSIIPTTGPNLEQRLDYIRKPVDEFFYTIIYVIMVYMFALSSFKTVDAVPNNIMRWMGVTVSTFHEQAGDPAGELSGKVYRGTQTTNAQIMQLMDRSGNALTDAQLVTGGLSGGGANPRS